MNRQVTTLIIGGVVLALTSVASGWFFVKALAAKSAAESERNADCEALQNIFRAKVFPCKENIEQVGQDRESLSNWVESASSLLSKGRLSVDKKTPTGFKQELQATVRHLSAQPGGVNGKVVAPEFYFGFDQYLGQSDSLPASENVDRLAVQLAIIERVCKELYAAKILALNRVTREVFDSAQASGESQHEDAGRRRRRDRDTSTTATGTRPDVAAGVESEYYKTQRFSFEFKARPAAFIEVLNRLAKMELFCSIESLEMVKESDSLKDYATKKSGTRPGVGADQNVEVDLATKPHGERIVTDPELEPPVTVKIELVVYSFEGE